MPTVFPNNLGVQPMFTVNNPTYTKPINRTKKKLMLHSTATPGAPAQNFFPNWNSASAGASVEFVLDNEKILQFMPIGKNGVGCLKTWHCGGSGNNEYIATEVCEPIEAQMIPINYKEQGQGVKYPRTYSIKRIQMELKYLGYYKMDIDGSFGNGTKAAVIAFQKDKGLSQDGIVGSKTLAVLNKREGSYTRYDVESATPFFNKAYDNAVLLFAELCNYVGAKPSEIICHQEGYRKGIASNHSDVEHYFPLHGKPMDTFRADVQKVLSGTYQKLSEAAPASTVVAVVDPAYDAAVQMIADAGIISSPDYWKAIDEKKAVDNNYVMALIRQTGDYFCKKSYLNAIELFEGLECPVNLRKDSYDFSDVRAFAEFVGMAAGKINEGASYEDAVKTLVDLGIINTPSYWTSLEAENKAPHTNYMQALIRQSGSYFCGTSFAVAVDAFKKPIGMNSVQYWKDGKYSYSNVVCLIKATAAAV